jgi:hypothetical protein
MSDEEEFDENDELDEEGFDDDLGDDDFEDGPLEDDLEIEDEDDDDDVRPPSRSSGDDDLQSLDYEQALKVNPKRAKMLRKRARHIEGVLDSAELQTPEGAAKAWAKLSEDTDTDIHRTYSVADEYSENDVLEHPKFGIGFVVEILSDRKISVLFEDGLRRLVCNVQK